jgi:hypothetical protein
MQPVFDCRERASVNESEGGGRYTIVVVGTVIAKDSLSGIPNGKCRVRGCWEAAKQRPAINYPYRRITHVDPETFGGLIILLRDRYQPI